MQTVLAAESQVRPSRPGEAQVGAIVVDVLYIGRDRDVIVALEAAGCGVQQAVSAHEAQALLRKRRYRVIAGEADDLLVQWLAPAYEAELSDVPVVLRDGAEIVAFEARGEPQEHRGLPLEAVVTRILARS